MKVEYIGVTHKYEVCLDDVFYQVLKEVEYGDIFFSIIDECGDEIEDENLRKVIVTAVEKYIGET